MTKNQAENQTASCLSTAIVQSRSCHCRPPFISQSAFASFGQFSCSSRRGLCHFAATIDGQRSFCVIAKIDFLLLFEHSDPYDHILMIMNQVFWWIKASDGDPDAIGLMAISQWTLCKWSVCRRLDSADLVCGSLWTTWPTTWPTHRRTIELLFYCKLVRDPSEIF